MLKSKVVSVVISGNTIKRYEELGYQIPRIANKKGAMVVLKGTVIEVKVKDLSPRSLAKVEVICDYCGKVHLKEYRQYNIQRESSIVKKDCCKKCDNLKSKEVLLEKYGVTSPIHIDGVKSKIEETNLARYGHKSHLKNNRVREKISITNIEKYGYDNPLKCKIIQEKVKRTNLEKYGHENAMQNKEIREKASKTCLEKYGVRNPMSLDRFKKRT